MRTIPSEHAISWEAFTLLRVHDGSRTCGPQVKALGESGSPAAGLEAMGKLAASLRAVIPH